MKKPWVGRIEFDVVVMAATEEEARDLVQEHARDEIQNVMLDWVDVEEVTSVRDVETQWRDAIPYGSTDDKTVADLVSAAHGLPAADDRTGEMFPPGPAPSTVGRAQEAGPADSPQGAAGPR